MKVADFPSVMVSMSRHRTLPEVLNAIVNGLCGCKNLALARIWLIQAGDVCGTCRFRTECPDQTRCLHLVASAGHGGEPGGNLTRLDGSYRRFPLRVRKIGKAGATGEALHLRDLSGNEEWIADPEWFRKAGIRTFAAEPLVFRDEVLGVLGIFDQMLLGDAEFMWLKIFADHAAVSIANANAFEEIAYLKERLEEENIYLRKEVTKSQAPTYLVGDGPAMRKVLQQLELVAPTDAIVLITGESGTGKELVARAIHQKSARSGRPMITINCSAVPETLFESEFFGHVKGAFTGAAQDKVGRFELADNGTLFLDEIGEVPLAMQAKLLRVLQEQEVERVGGTRPRKINVRVIAATNRDLRREVEAGRFRQDLFYRLNVFPVENPPLRERREDIPALAEHFIRSAAGRMNRRTPKFTEGAARQLMSHDWPGNVRELQNAVERAVILSRGGPLQFDLPELREMPRPDAQGVHAEPRVQTREELKRLERQSIENALRQAGGKVSGPGGAAEILGMKPTTLASRIKALKL